MIDILSIAGCPAITSGANAVLWYAQKALERAGMLVDTINIRHFPAEDLLHGRSSSIALQNGRHLLQQVTSVMIAVSVRNSGYPTALQALFDLLPVDAFDGKKVVLYISAATPMQFLACETSLKARFTTAGVDEILDAVYLPERLIRLHDRKIWLDESLKQRVDQSVQRLVQQIGWSNFALQPLLLNGFENGQSRRV